MASWHPDFTAQCLAAPQGNGARYKPATSAIRLDNLLLGRPFPFHMLQKCDFRVPSTPAYETPDDADLVFFVLLNHVHVPRGGVDEKIK